MLDTVRTVETPEGVALGMRVAGLVPRGLAFMLDLLVRATVYIGILIPLAFLGQTGAGIWMICAFLIEWFYPVYFEVWRGGATPGKRSLGLQVVHADGTTVGLQSSLLRNLMRFADFMPMTYGFGLLSMVLDRDFRRLGDLAAGTLVVYRESAPAAVKPPSAAPVLPPVPLRMDEQKAILSFSERAEQWTKDRARELATLAEPLTGAREAAGVDALHGVAAWLRSRR